MDTDHLRSVDTKGSEGLPHGVLQAPFPGIPFPRCGQITLRRLIEDEIQALIQKQAVVKTNPS